MFRGPRCGAQFEYIGDQKDVLSFLEGESIVPNEYVNEEWAGGEPRGRTRISPLNLVELVEDQPTSGTNVFSEYREYRFLSYPVLIEIN